MCRSTETPLIEEIKRLFLLSLETDTRISCRRAVLLVAEKQGERPRRAARLIHELVKEGLFRYVYECGQCFLEKNYTGMVRLSERIMMAPPGIHFPSAEGQVFIRIMPGVAFGDCRHPTTRLSVRGIDFALTDSACTPHRKTALDIGTGSGILAITLAALGVCRVLATDIDPCARKEARENVAVNQMTDQIKISDQPVDKLTDRFTLITGNLRPPTLLRYAAQISEKTEKRARLILSGMKEEEFDSVMTAYKQRFDCLWKETEQGWCATVLQKK